MSFPPAGEEKRYYIGEFPKDLKFKIEPFPEDLKKEYVSKEIPRSGLRLGAALNPINTISTFAPSPASSPSPSSSLENLAVKSVGLPTGSPLTPKSPQSQASKSSPNFGTNSPLSSFSQISIDFQEERIRRTMASELPKEEGKTLKEGALLCQAQGSKNWTKKHFVLNSKTLFAFGKRSKTPFINLEMENLEKFSLRTESDYAVEITVSGIKYKLIAETFKDCEEWALCFAQVAPPALRTSMILTSVNVSIPSAQIYKIVPIELTSTAQQVKEAVFEKMPTAANFVLCLRRGDHVKVLESDESMQCPSLIFKTHVLEMRSTEELNPKTNSLPKVFEIEGYLQKQGLEGIRSWKKRYFATRKGNLYYFKTHLVSDDEETQDAIGLINIANAIGIDLETAPNVFEIRTSSRAYKLMATSKEEVALWVNSLRKIREYYRTVNFESWQKISAIKVIDPNKDNTVYCQKEGFLLKRGYFNKAFQERYFILSNGHLYFYTPSDSAQHYRGKIPLRDSHITIPTDEEEFCFNVSTRLVLNQNN